MYGLYFETFQLLMEYNLIVDETLMDYNPFWYNNELWGVLQSDANFPRSSEDFQTITLSGYALTSVGKELYYIVEPNTPSGYWERISKFIQDYYNVNLYKYPKPRQKASAPQNIPSSEESESPHQ